MRAKVPSTAVLPLCAFAAIPAVIFCHRARIIAQIDEEQALQKTHARLRASMALQRDQKSRLGSNKQI
jgi:hypothetical protein